MGSVWLLIAHVPTKNQVFDKRFISSQLYFDGKCGSSSQIWLRYKFGVKMVYLDESLGRKLDRKKWARSKAQKRLSMSCDRPFSPQDPRVSVFSRRSGETFGDTFGPSFAYSNY